MQRLKKVELLVQIADKFPQEIKEAILKGGLKSADSTNADQYPDGNANGSVEGNRSC